MAASHVVDLVAGELAELVNLAEALTDEQWRCESLCDGWTVRDVVIHVADHVHRSSLGALRALVRGGLSPTKSAQGTVARHRARSNADLVRWLGAPVRAPSLVQLAELMIHQQDIRQPLGLGREIPPERLTVVLDFCLSRKGSIAVAEARARAAGLHLRATDLAWAWGDGREVVGPAESLLMAVNGRATWRNDGCGYRTIFIRRSKSSN